MAVRTERAQQAGRLVTGLRLCCLAALAFSAAAALEYYGMRHAFCGPGSSCDVVHDSDLGRSVGAALPALGLFGFALLLVASLGDGLRARFGGLSFAVAGGLVGALLLLLQGLWIGAFCALCVGADGAALAAALFALPLLRSTELWPPCAPRTRRVWLAAAVFAIGAPTAFGLSRPTTLPSYVTALAVRDKITVVELSDFECPFCRALHPILTSALAHYGSRIHFVRKSYPLPLHLHARDAARAYLCAQAQGRGEPMADRLFTAPDLSAPSVQAFAAALGLDPTRFAACVRDPATDRALDEQMAAIRREGFSGLPMVWIGDQPLLGFDESRGAKPYEAALARAASHAHSSPPALPWALLAALEAVLLLPARRKAKPPSG
jgi:predicted DsbA family dithiol-disulfide isomerase/uncharacterized membrane protein